MKVQRFNKQRDFDRVIDFLTDCYKENKNMECWLPERFDDLINRIDILYKEERGKEANQDYTFLWEENNKIVAMLVPDGDSFNSCIKRGYEYLFTEMLDLGEKELLPLFEGDEEGNIEFLLISHDSLSYQKDELLKRGYVRQDEGDYDNVQSPLEKNYQLNLPVGFKHTYGTELEDNKKAKACHYGFHPQDDNGSLEGEYKEGKRSYQSRKESLFKNDNFESLIITDTGDICTYSFCYVDKNTSTAFIEPVCTREKYRKKGLCKQMLHGTIIRLKELGIKKAYINSFAWRKQVYNAAGFDTIDSIGFYTKKLKCNDK